MPKPNSTSNREYALLAKYRTIAPRDEIQVLGLNELIRDARTVHVEAIRSLEKDLAEEEDGESEQASTAAGSGSVAADSGAEHVAGGGTTVIADFDEPTKHLG